MNMKKLLLNRIKREYSEEGFEAIFLKLDLLHDLASAGRLAEATSLPPAQVKGWLEEFIFTAKETIREMETHDHGLTPGLGLSEDERGREDA